MYGLQSYFVQPPVLLVGQGIWGEAAPLDKAISSRQVDEQGLLWSLTPLPMAACPSISLAVGLTVPVVSVLLCLLLVLQSGFSKFDTPALSNAIINKITTFTQS